MGTTPLALAALAVPPTLPRGGVSFLPKRTKNNFFFRRQGLGRWRALSAGAMAPTMVEVKAKGAGGLSLDAGVWHRRWGVWAGSWRPSVEEWNHALSLLPQPDREKISKFLYLEDAKARLIGRLLIRQLSEKLGCSDSSVVRLPSGRPVISEAPKSVEFSLAHDGEWVLLEASNANIMVGCDIVQTTRGTQLERIKDRVFTEEEWKQVCECGSDHMRQIRLMRRWAVKEAIVKALGVGLKYGMKNIDVTLVDEPQDDCQELLRTGNGERPRKIRLADFLNSKNIREYGSSPSNDANLDAEIAHSPIGMANARLGMSAEEEWRNKPLPSNWRLETGRLDRNHIWASALAQPKCEGEVSDSLGATPVKLISVSELLE